VVFQGGGAVGAAAFGLLAQHAGLSSALLAAGIGLVLVALAGLLMPFKAISPDDLMPAGDWPDPQLVTERPPTGPVLVTIEYRPEPAGCSETSSTSSTRVVSLDAEQVE
jgi:hypothetical protein